VKLPSKRLRAGLLLAAIPALLGFVFVRWPVTAGAERNYGLDLLLKLRGRLPVPRQVCVVALDDASFLERDLDPLQPWPRGLYGELVETLRDEGAKAVAFDVLFEKPGDPEQDLRFELGLFDAGNVVLAAAVERVDDPRFSMTRLVEPMPALAESAAAVAMAELPSDDDGTIRETWLVPGDRPGLALAAYQVATGDVSHAGDSRTLLIDFYGPPRTIETVSLYQALDPGQYLPQGFFRDKIVFVGLSQPAASSIHESKDSFPTPFTGGRVGNTYGVEIHATIAANLLEGRGIHGLSGGGENVLLLAIALAATLIFVVLRPVSGVLALIVLQGLIWVFGYQAFARAGIWIPLIIPTLVQLPVAYGVSVIWYYLTTVREREKIRRAFSFYLSPDMIKKISESSESLSLGGEEVVGTALFTDIAGFTSIAEKLSATETAAMLNAYFSAITAELFETGGTLIKYIGDAVFAIWGAPLKMEDHAAQACRAAASMVRLRETKLVTRIGLHSGPMLVGNLGSDQRFDYTAIGDTINLAARLESLNKSTGTLALVSGETLDAAGDGLIVRYLGRVRVVGRDDPIRLYELLGLRGDETRPDAAAIARFEAAVEDYAAGRLREASEAFRDVLSRCGGEDGPSRLYLARIEAAGGQAGGQDWDGVITFTKK
jgi:adenylate cyclase